MSSFIPRYYEIEQALRARIAALEPHSPLPSDAELVEEFGVSRMTARGAVQRLVHEGLVYRVPGRGTFVADRPAHRSATHILSFSDEMRRKGKEPSSRVVLFAVLAKAGTVPTAGRAALVAEAATADDAELLGVAKGDPLLVERRLIRDQDGEPLEMTESRYVGARYGLDVDFDVELPK